MRTRSRGNHVRGEVIHFFLHSLGAGSVLLANATTKIKKGIDLLSMLGQCAITQTRYESYSLVQPPVDPSALHYGYGDFF